MESYKTLCMEFMRHEKIRYEDVRAHVLKISYNGENLTSIPIFLYFDEEGDPIISVKCWDIINFANHTELGVAVCNELNEKYRWVKFYVDKDGDVVAELDAYIEREKCGSVCKSLVLQVASVVDNAYPILMRALWG